MKKFKSLILTMVFLFSCFALTAFAEDTSVTITDDYQTLSIGETTYTRFNASALQSETEYFSIYEPVVLSASQREIISNIELERNAQETIIYASISFIDGGTLSLAFLQDDYINLYQDMVNGQTAEYIIDFEWPKGNTVTAGKTALFGEATTLFLDDIEWSDWYYVTAESEDKSLAVLKGILFIIEDSYYYTDFAEAGIANGHNFSPYDSEELAAYTITDATLIENLKVAEQQFYEDDMGFLYDDNFTEKLSAIFLIFVFAVVPFIILIICLILAIRTKGAYRKIFITTCSLATLVLAVFASITSFIMLLK